MSDYSLKYLKYKQKYLKEIKNQVGGEYNIKQFANTLKAIFSTEKLSEKLLAKFPVELRNLDIDDDSISDHLFVPGGYGFFEDQIDIKYIITFIIKFGRYHYKYDPILLINFIKLYKQDYFNKTRLLEILTFINSTEHVDKICKSLADFYEEIIKERNIFLVHLREIHELPENITWISESDKPELAKLISEFKELKKIYNTIAELMNKMVSFKRSKILIDSMQTIFCNIVWIGKRILGNDDFFLSYLFCSSIINLLANVNKAALSLQDNYLVVHKECGHLSDKCKYIVDTFRLVFCIINPKL